MVVSMARMTNRRKRALTRHPKAPVTVRPTLKLKPKWKIQGSFPFLRLPQEIRDEIYKYLLATSETVEIKYNRYYVANWKRQYRLAPPPCPLDLDTPKEAGRKPAILQVNNQIHDEASSILYGYNNFLFADGESVGSFLSSAPLKYCDKMRNIDIEKIDLYGLNGITQLARTTNLTTLTLRFGEEIYGYAWGGGSGRGLRMEDALGVQEFLLVRGVLNLVIVDEINVEKNFPYLAKTKDKLGKLLKKRLEVKNRLTTRSC